jgi:hypothetical protein
MPDDAVTQAPDSVRGLKLLDPACGSGHFLVIAFELLFFLYQEEARHRGELPPPIAADGPWSPRWIVESILEHNLHGIDIDPRAVQIAAAALMLKARLLCADAEPRTLDLVAPDLSLASLPDNDPALVALYRAVEHETGIPPALTGRIIDALAGADHLGTLLKVDTEINAAIDDWTAQLSHPVSDQGELFGGFGPRRRKRITAEHARATLLSRLEDFLDHHTRGADLGLRLRGEQLAAGVRFVRMVREGQYDLVIGNPPYQGTSKMADKAYVEKHYPRGKADLYACFLERGLQLAKDGGVSALLTMRNWMFLGQFAQLRTLIRSEHDLRVIGDFDRGAFDEVPNELLAVCVAVIRKDSIPAPSSIALLPTPFNDKSYDRSRTDRKRAAVFAQTGKHEFSLLELAAVTGEPIVYWWNPDFLSRYVKSPKVGALSPARAGAVTGNHTRFLRLGWELHADACLNIFPAQPLRLGREGWVRYVKGARGMCWIDPCDEVCNWARNGLEIKTLAEFGYRSYTRQIRNEDLYFRPGIAVAGIGSVFSARAYRWRAIFDNMAASVFPDDMNAMLCSLNSSISRVTIQSLNPGVHFEISDVNRLPRIDIHDADTIIKRLELAFKEHEAAREPSVEFASPSGSPWRSAQAWAQAAVDRSTDMPLAAFQPEYEPPQGADHLSFGIGVALGRFGATGEGVLAEALPTALPHGLLFLSDASDHDSLAHPAAAPILAAWDQHGPAIDDQRTLRHYLQDRFFPDVHRKMYENRPIYFPLSSVKKGFVAYVSIHRWRSSTLNDLLAEHLYPAKRRLEGEQADLRPARDSADKKAAREAEKRLGQVAAWLEELTDFIAKVEQCAENGPPPPDSKTTPREVDARYEMDLDDGVMINAAALWPLLEPQWKDPKKWWKELANAEGKKDYDWAHLAKRYFPTRVDAKCQIDPSLGVAHGCFWNYHPARAYQWELRLQDEIRPDFTLDEPGSDAARAAFEAAEPKLVAELVAKEQQRRQRKLAKAGQADATDDDAQGDLGLADPDAEEADADADEELSA